MVKLRKILLKKFLFFIQTAKRLESQFLLKFNFSFYLFKFYNNANIK